MPVCELCGDEAPVLREDDSRAWWLCAECFRLNTPAASRPARPAALQQDAAARLDAAMAAWAQRVGVVLAEEDPHAG